MTALLEIEHIAVGYDGMRALQDVSLRAEAGSIVALVGANGAGKTSLLRAISGLVRAEGGTIRFAGDDVTRERTESLVARGISVVPEGRGMLRDLTVAENLEMGGYAIRDRRAVADATDRPYATFPILGERRDQKAGRLSGGQQQMLAVARALMSSPRLLLVDEASLGLSPVMTETVFALIADVRRTSGTAVLLVEQNAGALDLADRAFVLEKGQVVDRAEGAEMRAMQGRLRDAYLGRREAG